MIAPIEFKLDDPIRLIPNKLDSFSRQIIDFKEFGKETIQRYTHHYGADAALKTPTFINEFWTSKQRAANCLHEISYRACFKPQLPRFFIERLTQEGDIIYDPFMGRGTTLLESALMGRIPYGCDINPLSITMTRPRLNPPELHEVEERLEKIDFNHADESPEDLLAFYHPKTLRHISALKEYLKSRRDNGDLESVDEWIAMVAMNRLTGHSPGFFSVYTLPPNQAVSVKSQLRINEKRKQVPPLRDVKSIILKKSKKLMQDLNGEVRDQLAAQAKDARLLVNQSWNTPDIDSESVSLIVTSPPFLNVVQYDIDNWLRCWFLDIDSESVELTMCKKLEDWKIAMTKVFRELQRVLKPGGHIAFEVGEVHKGKTQLETTVLEIGVETGLKPLLVLINDQKFTKTANCWGVDNNFKGTNTNRIVLFRKTK